MDGVGILEGEVRELIRRRGLDPVRDRPGIDALVADAMADYDERSVIGSVPVLPDPAAAHKAVVDAVAGLGPLQRYLDDPEVEEIWINSPSQVFVARRGEAELTTTMLTDAQVRDLVEQMLKASGRRLDLSSPFVDASLPGGERIHAVIPDVTRRHWSVNIRKYVVRASGLDELVALGSLTPHAAAFLAAAVRTGLNVLVSGATQAACHPALWRVPWPGWQGASTRPGGSPCAASSTRGCPSATNSPSASPVRSSRARSTRRRAAGRSWGSRS